MGWSGQLRVRSLGSNLWVLSALGGLFAGCAREPIPDYVLSPATQALPESHQKQIETGLIRLFGRPTAPRWMKAGAEAPAAEPAKGAAADAGQTDTGQAAANVYGGVLLEEIMDARRLLNGAEVYRQQCAGCHGVTGDGNGPAAAYLLPKPRDYRKGVFKFTATPYGYKPARMDLERTIRRGAKGTSMPPFPWMSDEDLNDVIDYVILLSQRGEVELNVTMIAESDYEADETIDPAEFLESLTSVQESWSEAQTAVVLAVTAEPAYNDETIAAGRKAFLTLGCSKCHGEDNKGQTEWISPEFLAAQAALPEAQRIKINYDAWGSPAPAADLTARMLHGGRRPIDIYRRIYTGINGTPMPAFAEIDPATIWHLVHYVQGIVEGRKIPEVSVTDIPGGEPTPGESTDETATPESPGDEPSEETPAAESPDADEPDTEAPATEPAADEPPTDETPGTEPESDPS